MIKNIIFDFGQVLVHFEPEYMVSKYVKDPEDVELLKTVLFDRLYWDKLDAGTITDNEVLQLSYKRIPERLWNVAKEIYYNWIYNIPQIEGMEEVVQYLKKSGKNLYLLSNISKYFAEHSEEIHILKYFDICVFSACCGHIKPDKEIFKYVCKKCNCIPEETIFIDDNVNNIEGAKNCGINTYLFDGDVNKLNTYIKKNTD